MLPNVCLDLQLQPIRAQLQMVSSPVASLRTRHLDLRDRRGDLVQRAALRLHFLRDVACWKIEIGG